MRVDVFLIFPAIVQRNCDHIRQYRLRCKIRSNTPFTFPWIRLTLKVSHSLWFILLWKGSCWTVQQGSRFSTLAMAFLHAGLKKIAHDKHQVSPGLSDWPIDDHRAVPSKSTRFRSVFTHQVTGSWPVVESLLPNRRLMLGTRWDFSVWWRWRVVTRGTCFLRPVGTGQDIRWNQHECWYPD